VKFKAGKNKQYRRYIKMCEKTKEIQESHIFREGDCFYHQREGVEEIAIIRNDRIISTPDRSVNCPTPECTWLPTEEELEKMADEISLTPEDLRIFLEDNTGTFIYRPTPGTRFRRSEERWLTYYMIERYGKVWSIQDQEWKKVKL